MRALLFIGIVLSTSAAAVADEGEVFVGGSVGVDAMWLKHPLAPSSLLPDEHTALVPVPRLLLDVEYGLTNELAVTAGVSASGASNVTTTDVAVGGVSANLITGTYGALALPLGVRWRLDSGGALSLDVGAAVAPIVAGFFHTIAVDRAETDSAGRPARLPLVVDDSYVPGAEVRLEAGVELRLATFVLTLRPVGGVAWVHDLAWSIGAELAVHVPVDLGPL